MRKAAQKYYNAHKDDDSDEDEKIDEKIDGKSVLSSPNKKGAPSTIFGATMKKSTNSQLGAALSEAAS